MRGLFLGGAVGIAAYQVLSTSLKENRNEILKNLSFIGKELETVSVITNS